MSRLLFFVSMLMIVACDGSKELSVEQIKSTSWESLTSSDGTTPLPRHEAAFIAVNDKFYLLGGRRIQPVSIYDPQKNNWVEGTAPPIEIHHFQPVVYEGKIIIAGAFTGKYPREKPLSTMYIYDPETDAWSIGPEIPQHRRRGSTGAVLDGDDLYLICGIIDGHQGNHSRWVDRYNFKSKIWTELQDAPRPRDHFQAVLLNDKIYSGAGRTTVAAKSPFKNTIAEVDVYQIKKNSWIPAATAIPTERAGNMALKLGTKIAFIGGESFEQKKAHEEFEAYDPVKNTWETLPNMPQGRHGSGCIIHHKKLYTASGNATQGGGNELSDLISISLH